MTQQKNSFGMGVLVAFVLLCVLSILIGWIPIIGWVLAPLIAGYFGGKRVSTAGKGFLVGFTAAILGVIISIFFIIAIFSYIAEQYGMASYGVMFGVSLGAIILISSILEVIFCGLGGAIGAGRAAPAAVQVPTKILLCKSCGMENPHTSSYCSRCGKSLLPSPALSDKQIKTMVLGYIHDRGGELDVDECADELGLTAKQVKRVIGLLKKEGKLEEEE